jgi:hypothetical protein
VQNIDPGVRDPATAYVAIYRYLLGDFAPYIYRTDDYGKSWTRLTDGRNGIAPDEPTRVVREDPVRPGLLYAGTEFGLYVSFDRGGHWQKFQLNLPATPVTDIRLAHGDLVLSTQGRGFWILDNLDVLRQLPPAGEAVKSSRLYKPEVAVRIPASGDDGPPPWAGPEFPLTGAQIDYYVAPDLGGTPLTLTILDAQGRAIRSFTSSADAGSGRGGDTDELGRFHVRYPTALDARPGMHRFTWDLRYSGAPVAPTPPAETKPSASPTPGETAAPKPVSRPRYPAGPVAAPGDYTVVLSGGSFTQRQPLHIMEDPRVTASGVTDADLSAQLEHNLRVLKLVHDTNFAVARVKAAQKDPAKAKAVEAIAGKLITPPIRYSQPGLQTHVSYLYGETNFSDQKVGRDAIERYEVLRRDIDAMTAELNAVLGPPSEAEMARYYSGGSSEPARNEDDDES